MKHKFHEGQKVRIIGNSKIHHYAILGSIGTITRPDKFSGGAHYQVRCKTTSGFTYQNIVENDLVAVGAKVV